MFGYCIEPKAFALIEHLGFCIHKGTHTTESSQNLRRQWIWRSCALQTSAFLQIPCEKHPRQTNCWGRNMYWARHFHCHLQIGAWLMPGALDRWRNLTLRFAANSLTPASLSQFLGAREPFCGMFFNPHDQHVALPIAETDKHCSFNITWRKKSHGESYQKVSETDLLQWESHSNPSLWHFACGCAYNDWFCDRFCLGFQKQFEIVWFCCVVCLIFICQAPAMCKMQAYLVACPAAAEAWVCIFMLLLTVIKELFAVGFFYCWCNVFGSLSRHAYGLCCVVK